MGEKRRYSRLEDVWSESLARRSESSVCRYAVRESAYDFAMDSDGEACFVRLRLRRCAVLVMVPTVRKKMAAAYIFEFSYMWVCWYNNGIEPQSYIK